MRKKGNMRKRENRKEKKGWEEERNGKGKLRGEVVGRDRSEGVSE